MRMRKKKNLDVRFAACADVMVFEPKQLRGKWRALFGNDNPLHLEIGCGKGRFAIGMAELHPDVNFIAVEREEGALIMAAERCEEHPLPNLRFVSFDAAELREVFAPAEVDRIYLNFSDPWPKARHARRRLTSNEFFKLYDQVLTADGTVEFKTDNRPLFDFSVEELETSELFVLDQLSYDLHNDSTMNQGNIMTEYEAKFSSMGNPICKLIAKRR